MPSASQLAACAVCDCVSFYKQHYHVCRDICIRTSGYREIQFQENETSVQVQFFLAELCLNTKASQSLEFL